jgi:galactokinase
VSAYAYVPVTHQGDAAMPHGWRFLVLPSGVEADKAGSARERYNRASLATQALLEVWRRAGESGRTLAGALATSASAEDRLRHVIASSSHEGFSADDLSVRLSHFKAEDARIPAALSAFQDEDASRLGELSAASQEDADRWLGNQIVETRDLVRAARDAGAFAATSFGAGFGGSVWALAAAADADRVAERAMAQYRLRYPKLEKLDWFAARPGPPMLSIRM